MYAIVNTYRTFVANKETHYYFVKSAKFTELGWKIKLTRMPHYAKKYKVRQCAFNMAKKLGIQYEVVEL